ncbi:hypothetical protein [Streptomyces sp. NPDC127190]|uniref:hypothetical protein n=1 Tax=unclassified Streptomyces TaxID=2593676 RepID=UPI003645DAA5
MSAQHACVRDARQLLDIGTGPHAVRDGDGHPPAGVRDGDIQFGRVERPRPAVVAETVRAPAFDTDVAGCGARVPSQRDAQHGGSGDEFGS